MLIASVKTIYEKLTNNTKTDSFATLEALAVNEGKPNKSINPKGQLVYLTDDIFEQVIGFN